MAPPVAEGAILSSFSWSEKWPAGHIHEPFVVLVVFVLMNSLGLWDPIPWFWRTGVAVCLVLWLGLQIYRYRWPDSGFGKRL